MKILSEIKKAIFNSKNTAIVSHHNPDGDTLGSAFALCSSLRNEGKTCDVLCADELPSKYHFLDKIEIINKFELNKYDLIIFVDCAERHLTGKLLEEFDISSIKTINIDHHSTNANYADLNHVLSDYSSTCEIILELLQYLKIEIDKETAEYLYIGIITDTGQFAYSYTSDITHKHAAYLLSCSIDFSKLNKLLFNTIPLKKLLLTQKMLDNLVMLKDNKVAISLLSLNDFSKCNATGQDSDSLVNMLLSVDTVDVAVLVRQIDNNNFKASFRSSDHVDISKSAKSLNGGGHKQAAGATITCNINNVVSTVVNAIEEANIL